MGRFPVTPIARNWRLYIPIFTALLFVVGFLVWWWTPASIPVVAGVRQLTDDGEPKVGNGLVTDGLRLYFGEGMGSYVKIRQVSVNGGQTALLPVRFKNMGLQAIVPDASALLLGSADENALGLWLQPLPAGEARLLVSSDFDGGNFLPDGQILFT